jgi:hypothetical protein
LFVELGSPTDGGPLVYEAIIPEGGSPPLHVHADLDDSFYVLDGRMVVRCGDDVQLATAGSWVPFPRGVPHTFRVMGGPARILGVNANDSFVSAVRELGRPAVALRLPVPTGEPSTETLMEVLDRHGVTNVGPPMSEQEAERLSSALSV